MRKEFFDILVALEARGTVLSAEELAVRTGHSGAQVQGELMELT